MSESNRSAGRRLLNTNPHPPTPLQGESDMRVHGASQGFPSPNNTRHMTIRGLKSNPHNANHASASTNGQDLANSRDAGERTRSENRTWNTPSHNDERSDHSRYDNGTWRRQSPRNARGAFTGKGVTGNGNTWTRSGEHIEIPDTLRYPAEGPRSEMQVTEQRRQDASMDQSYEEHSQAASNDLSPSGSRLYSPAGGNTHVTNAATLWDDKKRRTPPRPPHPYNFNNMEPTAVSWTSNAGIETTSEEVRPPSEQRDAIRDERVHVDDSVASRRRYSVNHFAEESALDGESVASRAGNATDSAETRQINDNDTVAPEAGLLEASKGSSAVVTAAALGEVARMRANADVDPQAEEHQLSADDETSEPDHDMPSVEQHNQLEDPSLPVAADDEYSPSFKSNTVGVARRFVGRTIPESTPLPQGLQLEGVEGDTERDVDMDFASRCSTPLTILSSDVEEPESDHEDASNTEIEANTEDDNTNAKGKKAANQRTSLREAKGKVVREQGDDSQQSIEGPTVQIQGQWSVPRPPSMSPALGQLSGNAPLPNVVYQQSDFSPQSGRTRFTRSSKRKETSIVPKSEDVDTIVSVLDHDIEETETVRTTYRKIAKGASATAESASVTKKSPKQKFVRSSTRQATDRTNRASGTGDPGTTSNARPKSSRGHITVIEAQQPDGTWKAVNQDSDNVQQETANEIVDERESYITQSGRIVKGRRREQSIAPKEVPPKPPRRAIDTHRPAGAALKKSIKVRPPTSSKRKTLPEPGQNLADSREAAVKEDKADVPGEDAVVSSDQYIPAREPPGIPFEESEPASGAAAQTQGATAANLHQAEEIEGNRASLPEMFPAWNGTNQAPGVATYVRREGSTISKGKHPAGNPARPKQPTFPLANGGVPGLDSTGTSTTGQPTMLRFNERSIELQFQDLSDRQNKQNELIANMFRQNQILVAMMEDLKQNSLINEATIGQIRQQYSSQIDSGGPPKAQKGPRPRLTAVKVKDPEQKSASRKRKADKPTEEDNEFAAPASMTVKKKATHGKEKASVDDQRQSKRPRADRAPRDSALALTSEGVEREQEKKKIVEELRVSFLGKSQEIQVENCTVSRYDNFQQCKHCASSSLGDKDSCRFKGWRVFEINPETGLIVNQPWFDHQVANNEELVFPVHLNRNFTAQQSFRMKETVVKSLLPIITRELKHCIRYGAKRKAFEIGSRATCDRCSMTIFGGSWSCVACGKEYCFECESEMSDKAPLSEESYEHESARLYKCSKGSHSRINLFATTIFDLNVLQFHWLQMVGFAERARIPYDKQDVQQLLPKENVAQVLFPTIDIEVQQPGEQEERARAQATDNVTRDDLKNYLTTQCHDIFTPPPALEEPFPGHAFYRIDASQLTEALFDRMWQDGTPIVIENAGKGLTEDWTPQGFVDRSGAEHCYVFDCQAEVAEDSTIGEFYSLFNSTREEADTKVLKLKDWPWNAEFKDHCPSLYDDFLRSLPVPDYTRRDGVTNISAFFPTNTTPPDIGPKLYSALRGKQTEGGKGSTRMHMDIADAINIMTYTSKGDNDTQGCAIWHIYRKDDLDILRKFLKDKFGQEQSFTDPVHSQIFYLDSKLRQELFDSTGVYAHRIYQYPGQAVMIPAYCAHQVCNLSDCIKIACDFVSPPDQPSLDTSLLAIDSISRCAKITEEFRSENVVSDWKDDVLQLNNMMWYTWLFCLKFDVNNKDSPALPFDEANVGSFIDENSKGGQLGKAGLAHLKPQPQASGRIPQGGSKSLTPIWARRPETTNRAPPKAPRRGLQPGSGVAVVPLGTMSTSRTSASGNAPGSFANSSPGMPSHPATQPLRPVPPFMSNLPDAQSYPFQNTTYPRDFMPRHSMPLGNPFVPVNSSSDLTGNTAMMPGHGSIMPGNASLMSRNPLMTMANSTTVAGYMVQQSQSIRNSNVPHHRGPAGPTSTYPFAVTVTDPRTTEAFR